VYLRQDYDTSKSSQHHERMAELTSGNDDRHKLCHFSTTTWSAAAAQYLRGCCCACVLQLLRQLWRLPRTSLRLHLVSTVRPSERPVQCVVIKQALNIG
jgi:hypothetical protein